MKSTTTFTSRIALLLAAVLFAGALYSQRIVKDTSLLTPVFQKAFLEKKMAQSQRLEIAGGFLTALGAVAAIGGATIRTNGAYDNYSGPADRNRKIEKTVLMAVGGAVSLTGLVMVLYGDDDKRFYREQLKKVKIEFEVEPVNPSISLKIKF
jgi:hypothetical protein